MTKRIDELTEEERKTLFILVEKSKLRHMRDAQVPMWERVREYRESGNNSIKGLIYGLFLGIFGNLFVQFLYPLIEDNTLWQYNPHFVVNLMLILVSIIAIFLTLWKFQGLQKQNMKMIDEAVNNRDSIILEMHKRERWLEGVRQGLMTMKDYEKEFRDAWIP